MLSSDKGQGQGAVPRFVSFIVLIVIFAVIAGLFFRVMANFILPMFLAVILVIIFAPLHHWFCEKFKGHERWAAGLTTLTILLIFLVPLLAVVSQAANEAFQIYVESGAENLDRRDAAEAMARLIAKVGLDLPPEEIERIVAARLRQWLAPAALGTTQAVGKFLLGLGVMIVSLYYFLADGPRMIQAIMYLSPLDDRYEEQLIGEFGKISRTVVLATIVSAMVQGILAGIGYAVVGVEAVFLLIVLTTLLAMVPFVGAASVWGATAIWLLFIDQRIGAAIGLALYGSVIVSMADNVIKPFVLHGQSNIHPLLALLSVLGGVQALGPIGIFVGPMVVALLHAVLKMLHLELDAFSSRGPGRAKAKDKAAPKTEGDAQKSRAESVSRTDGDGDGDDNATATRHADKPDRQNPPEKPT